MVVREPEVERVDLFELGDVGVGEADLQGLDVILEVFDLASADWQVQAKWLFDVSVLVLRS